MSATDFFGETRRCKSGFSSRASSRAARHVIVFAHRLRKTLLAHALTATLRARAGFRVLLIGVDDHRRKVDSNLRAWGVGFVLPFKVLTRESPLR